MGVPSVKPALASGEIKTVAILPPALFDIPQQEAVFLSFPSSKLRMIRLFSPHALEACILLTISPTHLSATSNRQSCPELHKSGMMKEKLGSWFFAKSASS